MRTKCIFFTPRFSCGGGGGYGEISFPASSVLSVRGYIRLRCTHLPFTLFRILRSVITARYSRSVYTLKQPMNGYTEVLSSRNDTLLRSRIAITEKVSRARFTRSKTSDCLVLTVISQLLKRLLPPAQPNALHDRRRPIVARVFDIVNTRCRPLLISGTLHYTHHSFHGHTTPRLPRYFIFERMNGLG